MASVGSPVSRKTKTPPGRAKTGRSAPRIVLAAVGGLVCQLAFVVAHQTVLADYYTGRAQRAHAAHGSPDAALWARRALALNPDAGYAAYFLGLSEAEAGRYGEASEAFRRAMKTMGHRAPPLRELAACEEKTGDRAAAVAHFAEALAIEPLPAEGAVVPRATLGRLLFGLGRWADGLAQFRLALADAHGSRVPLDGLAAGYQYFGLTDAAVASAFGLGGAPAFTARASAHLVRLSTDPAQKPLIVSLLKDILDTTPASDRWHALAESVWKSIGADR